MVNADPLWQNALYFGNALSNILYGVELTLYVQTLQALSRSAKNSPSPDRRHTLNVLSWFSTITVFLATIFVSTQVIFGEQMWIIHYDYPGGMGKYYTDHSSVWYQTLGHGATVALQLSSDGLLISRFFTVSETTLLTKWILVLPCILWTATLASGLLLCFYCGVWHSNVFAGNAADIAMAYYALAIALNVLITLIFCGRIVTVGSSAGGKFGSDLSRKFYSAVASIIQFVLLRTTIGLVFLVTFALGSGVSAGFLSLYVMISCVSTQVLIIRVTLGPAEWEAETPMNSPMSWHAPALNTFSPSRSRKDIDLCIDTSETSKADLEAQSMEAA